MVSDQTLLAVHSCSSKASPVVADRRLATIAQSHTNWSTNAPAGYPSCHVVLSSCYIPQNVLWEFPITDIHDVLQEFPITNIHDVLREFPIPDKRNAGIVQFIGSISTRQCIPDYLLCPH